MQHLAEKQMYKYINVVKTRNKQEIYSQVWSPITTSSGLVTEWVYSYNPEVRTGRLLLAGRGQF